MSTDAIKILKNKANDALNKSACRFADLRFFEQILTRTNNQENLDIEIKGWSALDQKARKKIASDLIKKCRNDLKSGYWEFKSPLIKTKAKYCFDYFDVVPRYEVEYLIDIGHGQVKAVIETALNKIDIKFDNKHCKKLKLEEAINEATKVLVFATMY
jgi:hypothetical protein